MADVTGSKHGGYGRFEPKVGTNDNGEFEGNVRYEGTILVQRKVGQDWVDVLTDAPRAGDRIQRQELDLETGEYKVSKKNSTEVGAAPPKK